MRARHNHNCAAFGCRVSVPWARLMCGRHWALVPKPLQRDVWAAWNGGHRTPGWHDAVARAIASLATQHDLFAPTQADLFAATPAAATSRPSTGGASE